MDGEWDEPRGESLMPLRRRFIFNADVARWRSDASKGVSRSTITLVWMAVYGFVTVDLLLGIGSVVVLADSIWFHRRMQRKGIDKPKVMRPSTARKREAAGG